MVYIISGPMNSGKTTRFIEQYNKLIKDHKVGGFYTKKLFKDDIIFGFDVVDLMSNKAYHMGNKQLCESDNTHELGKYYIDLRTFDWCKTKINDQDADIYMIDEVGLLELRDQGFHQILKDLITSEVNLYITVRDKFVDSIIEHYKISQVTYV